MAHVTLENIYKIYAGDVTAVRDVSLHVKDQEFVVLVGPSGCGKSTTLRMIAGLEDISKGTLKIGDKVVNDISPSNRDIAMVFQDYALYPHMSVYENMAFSLKLRKFPKQEIDTRVREAARMLELEDYLDRKPKALSGGQRQRVAMGRAVVREPSVFLFDEPLSNLDAKMRVSMRAELAELHDRIKTTMIYVTHDQIEAMTLGDRIVVMKNGVIQQFAEPLDVYAYPANAFVASFIGTPPMNMFQGKLEQNGERIVFNGGNFNMTLPSSMDAQLKGHVNKAVSFGIRPEDLKIEGQQDPSCEQFLTGTMCLKETLGNELIVHMESAEHRFLCRVDSHDRPNLDGELKMYPILERAHVFDVESGANLTLPEHMQATAQA